MHFKSGSLVLLFAALALAAPVPHDSEFTSLERRALTGEEEISNLFRRADDLGLTQIHPEHGVSRGRSPTRGNAKHHRALGSVSPERSASPSPSRASSLANPHQESSLVAEGAESEGGAIQKLVARANKKNQKKAKGNKKKGGRRKKAWDDRAWNGRRRPPGPGGAGGAGGRRGGGGGGGGKRNRGGFPTTGGLRLMGH